MQVSVKYKMHWTHVGMVLFLWLIFSCVKILSANYGNGGKPLVLIPFMIKVSCYHTSNITLRVHYLSAPLALWLLATISSWSVYCLFLLANKIVGGYIFQEDPIIRSVVKVLELSSISHFQLCVSTFSSLLPPLTGSWEVQYSISVIKTVEDNPSIILRTCLYSSSRLLCKQINKYICKIIYYTYCNGKTQGLLIFSSNVLGCETLTFLNKLTLLPKV